VVSETELAESLAAPQGLGPRDRVSVTDLTYEALRDLIVHGDLGPGAGVVEIALAQRLSVSRTPLRQAIERLETDGLMFRNPNGRLHVSNVSRAEALQLFAVRIALEDLAITEAMSRITDNSIEMLGRYIATMRRIDEVQGNVADAGAGFHNLLYRTGENNVNRQVLGQLQPRIDRYRFLSTVHSRPRQRNAIQEHQDIYDAVKIRDVDQARLSLKNHLQNALDAVLDSLPS
jgi:DNA-binding GntR family transcriptional regulator